MQILRLADHMANETGWAPFSWSLSPATPEGLLEALDLTLDRLNNIVHEGTGIREHIGVLVQELVDRGFYSQEEAARSTNRNYVTRALGVEATVQVEVQEVEVQEGDIYLLCSDGLPDMVEDEDIHLTISTFSANLQMAGQQLIQLSNDHGGKDNVSVILTQVVEPFPARISVFAQFRRMFQ